MKPIQEQMLQSKGIEQQPLIERLRTRAAIRRSIKDRKSVQEGKPDRIAELLDESADEIESFSIFAWATFDGEGSYDLMLYEGNENYKEEYIKRNGEKYKDWVTELYLKEKK